MVGVDFHQLLTFEPQHHWGIGVAIYLFLGGLGGAMIFLAVANKMLLKREDPSMYAWSTIIGIILVNLGALFLLMDMFIWDSFWHGHIFEIFKVIYALFGAAVFNGNLHPWIQIGALTIAISSGVGLLWALAMADRAAILKDIPIVVKIANILKPFEGVLGWILLIFSTVLAFYTGFLLSVAPSIPSWSHPLLPVLFFISALSTGTAWYMLWTYFAKGKDEKTQEVRKKIAYQVEWADIVLIGLELLAILAYFNYLYYANAGGKYVFNLMINDIGFIGLFLILGLIVPWLLELIVAVKHSYKILIPIAAILVIFGGFLLRYYILHYGIYAYPWPS
jgi:formate-dependent nitrite reductase membrane component NrfD